MHRLRAWACGTATSFMANAQCWSSCQMQRVQLLLLSSRATIVAVVQHAKIAVHHQHGMLCGHRQRHLLIRHAHQHERLSWFVRRLGLWRYRWW